VIEWVCDFSPRLAQQWGRERNKIWHKGSLGDEDDVRTSNTRRAQRKCTIPHSSMKTCRNITEFVVITLTRGRHVPLNNRYVHAYIELQCWLVPCHSIYTICMWWKIVTGDEKINGICTYLLRRQHQLEAFASDLGDDQSRYLFTSIITCCAVASALC